MTTIKQLRELLDNPAIKDDEYITTDFLQKYSEDTEAVESVPVNARITGSGSIHFEWDID